MRVIELDITRQDPSVAKGCHGNRNMHESVEHNFEFKNVGKGELVIREKTTRILR